MHDAPTDTVEPQPKPQSQFSRWSIVILMGAILAVAGVVSALTAMRFAIHGREVEVPQLAGKTKDEVEGILKGRGLKLKVSSSRFSSEVPEGKVLEQNPPSGTRLRLDRTVKVLLSLGEQRFAVPNLVGTSLRSAQLTLAQRRLMMGDAEDFIERGNARQCLVHAVFQQCAHTKGPGLPADRLGGLVLARNGVGGMNDFGLEAFVAPDFGSDRGLVAKQAEGHLRKTRT